MTYSFRSCFITRLLLLALLALPAFPACTGTAPSIVCTDPSGQPTTDPLKASAAGIDQLIQIAARLATYTEQLQKDFAALAASNAALKTQVAALQKENADLKATATPTGIPQYIIDFLNTIDLFNRRVAAIVTLPDPTAGIEPVQ